MNNIKARDEECQFAKKYSESLLGMNEIMPFSFEYCGKTYHGFDSDFSVDRKEHLITAKHNGGQLTVTVRISVYLEHAAFEWTVYFKNISDTDSAVLKNVNAADTLFAGNNQLLCICNSDMCDDPYSHQPQEFRLNAGTSIEFEPFGGRPTNLQFPFYRLVSPITGIFISIGWPGQWKTRFQAQSDGVRLTAGQASFDTYLKPHEEVRTPLISLLFHDADSDDNRTANLWRRWFIDCNMRKINGEVMQPVIAGLTSFLYEEMRLATDRNQIDAIKAYISKGIPLDYWWMDAGWYFKNNKQTIENWVYTGSWEVDTDRFPSKFKAVSDHAASAGVKTLLWFEPERVAPDTYLAGRPEWLLNGDLADMGNRDYRDWITERVDTVLKEGGISLYRQDFNIDPLAYWQWGDMQKGVKRIGITENLYIQGYLKYWDELIRRHPDMMIDSCASGGRRNDLETMRRAIPLHKTDANYSDQDHKQSMHHTLYRWFPYFGTIVVGWGDPAVDDLYAFRSSFVPWTALSFDIRRDDLDFEVIRRYIKEKQMISNCFYSDYYMLTPWSNKANDWIGWMFIDSEKGEGVVQLYRRGENNEPEKCFRLFGLDADAAYRLEDLDGGVAEETGAFLMKDGLTVKTIDPRSGKIIRITRLDKKSSINAYSGNCESK